MSATAHHKLSDLAADRIDALLADGITPTPAEVVMINALAWEIETPRHRIEMSRGTPLFAGRVALWPLTLAAEAWWSAAIKMHTGETAQMQLLAYAMAHARTPDALDAVSPAVSARVAATWAKGLHVRPKELSIIVGEVLAQDEDLPRLKGPKDGSKGLSAGQIVAILTSTVGGTPRMWETEVAIGYIREQMRAVAAQQAAENGGSLKDSDMVAATRQMGLYVEQIRARARGENGDN